jgi:FixJ family two-component response regulator
VVVMAKLVSVVDDDESVRESLPDLLRAFGADVQAFASAEDFLCSEAVSRTACLLLDVAMPGMTGPELQEKLGHLGHEIPTIFITAQFDDRIRTAVLKRGAVACLLKPFSEAALLEAVTAALRKGQA